MLYDQAHGTSLAEARNLFLDFFLKNSFINPVTHETGLLWLVKQKTMITQEFASFGNSLSLFTVPLAWLGQIIVNSSVSNGWNGAMMHAWEPALIERHYPYQKAKHVIDDGSTAHLSTEWITDQIATPFFALLAAEVGDTVTRDKLVAWCNSFYKAEWVNGMLVYPVGADSYINQQTGINFTPWPQNLTGVLVAYAAANPHDGILTLHNNPFTQKNFDSPKVTGVDFPNALLKRAIYDFEKEALVMTIQGGAENPSGTTSFNVTQLDPTRTWELFMDGVSQGNYSGTSSVTITAPLDARHDIVLIAE
jgi:hypothetical protein